jgi:AAA domain
MSEQYGHEPATFVVTKAYRRFTEVCDACRRFRSVGLGYGPAGTGKTESARYYAQWEQVESFLPESLITFTGRSAVDEFYPYKPFTFASAQSSASITKCRTVFYTAPVAASPSRIERQVLALFAAFSYLVEAANERHQGKEDFLVTRRSSPFIELLIVDEANRLKDAGLEIIRDLYDKGKFGVVLLGMPAGFCSSHCFCASENRRLFSLNLLFLSFASCLTRASRGNA